MNWIPNDYRNPNAGNAPEGGVSPTDAGVDVVGGAAGLGGEGAAQGPPPVPPAGPPPEASRSAGLPDLSPVAVAAGLVGLLAGPVLIGDPTARYVILVADLLAIAFGALGIWASLRRFARLDYAVAAIVMGGASLFLWVSYVSDPPQGGT